MRSSQERAYWGLDGEIGRLLWSNDPCCDDDGSWVSSLDAELRAFAGGFYFNNSAEGFEEISGPRVRTELRLYDLALLGEGQILYSSDFPHGEGRDEAATEILERGDITADQKQKILYGNAAEFFGAP